MKGEYRIARARRRDLPLLPAIELGAATRLAGHAPRQVLEETTGQDELSAAQRRGHVWVALAHDVPAGYARLRLLEGGIAHLDEIDVHPAHMRRGLGTRLVAAAWRWATRNACSCVTLTTFRDLPWNMPFYARLGFEAIAPDALCPVLAAIVAEEARRGLARDRRVAMRKAIA